MRYGSVCSGIEAASCAWHPLGWEAAWFAEIEKFPSAVLAHRYPSIPNHGDMTKYKEWANAGINLLVGGTPCQSFSVAGLRKGLADPRGNLALIFLGLVDHFRPSWVVWENVPGVLSSSGGRDFGSFLGGLGQLGYGWSYRILDAQYFGVAQRRRRVLVVGHLGGWQPATAVLFERSCLSGDLEPSRAYAEGDPKHLEAGPSVSCYDIAPALRNKNGASDTRFNGADERIVAIPISTQCAIGRRVDDEWDLGIREDGEPSPTMTKAHSNAVGHNKSGQMVVRRFMPRECERLQGFPDDYTLVPYRGKAASDGPRYKALGNSMAVPVMKWIGQRIQMVENLKGVGAS